MIEDYLQEIFGKYSTGDASERSYYPALENLLKGVSGEIGDYSILVEGRNSSVGIPDFKVKDGKDLLIGYVEAKDPGRDLDKLTAGEQKQIQRYIAEYDKIIVTNFIEFRFYENHVLVDTVFLTQPVTLQIGKPVPENEAHLQALLERFFYNPIQQIYKAKRLSEVLAKKTRNLKELIVEEIDLEDNATTKTEEMYEMFKKTLKADMEPDEFADMYAQTITFGLFVARINSKSEHFDRLSAYKFIPKTISLLKEIFKILSWQDLPSHIEWYADEIAETLAYTDIEKVTSEFFSEGKGRDPIIHFYETFLADYDPKEREKRGVYYTPQQVVSYITRSIHGLLKEKLGVIDGFADPSVTVLDPAGGTLTFPAEAIAIAREEYVSKHGDGGWRSLVKQHILKNFYAFELLMAPYAIGHLKISLLLKELGYEMDDSDRFKLYLTNTLDFKEVERLPLLMLVDEITEESKLAYEVKTKEKVLVIMGNPPYSVSSSNKILENTGFSELYESYKEMVRKEEKNIQPLSDDYIKFIAFAHWKIKQAKQGVVGMITNNSYLDGLIHRDMRRRLMEDFNEIYVFNLHGNSRRQEKTPEGGKDENVFDIQQGVSILLMVKGKGLKKSVKYADVWGKREEKYEFLEENSSLDTEFVDLKPEYPQFFLTIKIQSQKKKYSKFLSVTQIFNQHSNGVKTHRDEFILDNSKEILKQRINRFINSDALDDNTVQKVFGLKNTTSWNIINARNKLKKEDLKENLFETYDYRPFDKRFIYYNPILIDRPRPGIDSFFKGENFALCLMRQVVINTPLSHFLVIDSIPDMRILLSNRGAAEIFPLYLYPKSTQQGLLDGLEKIPNIKYDNLPDIYSGELPEAVFYYIYAILYSNIYRKKYEESLKIDFPRIPFTSDADLFRSLSELGEKLVELHLLKAKEMEAPGSRFMGDGSSVVEKPTYVESEKRMYINASQYFDSVEPEVWNYFVGGYQVAYKWLKDRKGKALSFEDALHYRKVITALELTIELQERIDDLYPEVERTMKNLP